MQDSSTPLTYADGKANLISNVLAGLLNCPPSCHIIYCVMLTWSDCCNFAETVLEELPTDDNDQLVSTNNKHGHPPDDVEVRVAKVIEKMKDRAREETTPLPRIYQETLWEVATEEMTRLLPFYQPSLQSKVRYIAEGESGYLHFQRVERMFSLMVSGQKLCGVSNFFLDPAKMCSYLFSTEENLQLLSEADVLYVDGNFNVCPRLFYQILTVHAFKDRKQFPLAYFILPGKSCEIYNTAFTLLNEAVHTTNKSSS